MLPGEGVDVVVAVDVVLGVELPPLEREEPDGVVLGTTTVTVTLGVFLVTVVPPVFDFLVGLVGVVPGWNAAYSTVPAGAE